MKRKSLGLVLACVCYTTAYAAPALPGSDSELRAMEQNREQNVRQTVIEATGSVAKVQGEDQFTLQRVTFTGQEIIDTAIFAELIQTYIGQTVTLSDLQNAADKITAYCRQQGYAVAAAFYRRRMSKTVMWRYVFFWVSWVKSSWIISHI